jgi:hypothetical protein
MRNRFYSQYFGTVLSAIGVILAANATAYAQVPVEREMTVNLSGTAADKCVMPTAASKDIDFQEINQADGTLKDGLEETAVFPIFACNQGIDFTFESTHGGLFNGSNTDQSSIGFTNKVIYKATVNWGGSSYSYTPGITPASGNLGPQNGILSVTINPIRDHAKILLAGAYSDILTLKVVGIL